MQARDLIMQTLLGGGAGSSGGGSSSGSGNMDVIKAFEDAKENLGDANEIKVKNIAPIPESFAYDCDNWVRLGQTVPSNNTLTVSLYAQAGDTLIFSAEAYPNEIQTCLDGWEKKEDCVLAIATGKHLTVCQKTVTVDGEVTLSFDVDTTISNNYRSLLLVNIRDYVVSNSRSDQYNLEAGTKEVEVAIPYENTMLFSYYDSTWTMQSMSLRPLGIVLDGVPNYITRPGYPNDSYIDSNGSTKYFMYGMNHVMMYVPWLSENPDSAIAKMYTADYAGSSLAHSKARTLSNISLELINGTPGYWVSAGVENVERGANLATMLEGVL